MRYDSKNNGFDDDPWVDLSGDMNRAAFKPDRVGKYQFYVKVCEDYGKCDDTLSDPVERTMIDILNLAPEVSFELEGKNPQPNLPAMRVYTPSEMFGWTLTDINSTSGLDGKRMRWNYSETELFGKIGKKQERFYRNSLYTSSGVIPYFSPFSDAGYGKNGYNLYRPIGGVDPNKTFSQPLLIPVKHSPDQWKLVAYSLAQQPNFVSTPTHLYFSVEDRFFALNKSKIGRYEFVGFNHTLPDGSYYDYILHTPSVQYYSQVRFPNIRDWTNVPYEFVTEDKKQPGVSYASVRINDPLAYYVTDDTVYQLVEWQCSCLYEDREYKLVKGLSMFTYDLKTGQMVTNGMEKGFTPAVRPESAFSRNGNLKILNGYQLYTYDRYLNLKSSKALPRFTYDPAPPQYGCSGGYNLDRIFEDIDENTYVYDEWNCYNKSIEMKNYGSVYLVKFDPDFNVVWRVKLEGTDFLPNVDVYTHDIPDMVVNPAGKEM
jgi:hypothetical protein